MKKKKQQREISDKKLRLILGIVAGVIGLIWWLLMTLATETENVYYEWSDLSTEELAIVEAELQVTFPEDFTVLSLSCHNTFVPDVAHSVEIYTDAAAAEATAVATAINREAVTAEYLEEGNKITVSYYGVEDCSLHTQVVQNGVEHRENLLLLSLLRLLIVGVVVTLIVMPKKNSLKME